MADVSDLKVVVIGAGATGLLLAQGLKLVRVALILLRGQLAHTTGTARMALQPKCTNEKKHRRISLAPENGE